jgi:hypothetical protein
MSNSKHLTNIIYSGTISEAVINKYQIEGTQALNRKIRSDRVDIKAFFETTFTPGYLIIVSTRNKDLFHRSLPSGGIPTPVIHGGHSKTRFGTTL